jgi:hypothetical protein
MSESIEQASLPDLTEAQRKSVQRALEDAEAIANAFRNKPNQRK